MGRLRRRPHLLACAALLPNLVTAAASLASLAPADAEGLDWFDGMGEENADDYRLLRERPDACPRQAGEGARGKPRRVRALTWPNCFLHC